MCDKYVRLALLVAMLMVSLHVAAAPRFWTLTGVQIGGQPVTGYFSYDDVTQTVSNWNVRVGNMSRPGLTLPELTFLPGNSGAPTAHLPPGGQLIILESKFVASHFAGARGVVPLDVVRALQFYTLSPLDGSNPTVSLDLTSSFARFSIYGIGLQGLNVTAGSLTLMPVPPPVAIAQVDEFYNPALGHYFITADAAEKQALDNGQSGWERTGESFKAYAKGSSTRGSVNPVCRFYSPPLRLVNDVEYYESSNSHFFSADAGECATVAGLFWYAWVMEGDNAFQIDLPDKTSGACPAGTIPVYRLTNQRTDSSHRYTTSTAIKTQMLAQGYLAEGYGPDGVVECARCSNPQS